MTEQKETQVELVEVLDIEEVEESREAFFTPLAYWATSPSPFGRLFDRKWNVKF